MSQSLFLCPTYDWANSGSAGVFWAVVNMVLVLQDLVLIYRMGVEFNGKIFLSYSKRVKWQQCVTAGVGLSLYILS